MPKPKNHGPCVLEVDDQLCHLHYLSIVVPDRGGKNAVKKQRSGEFGEIHIVESDYMEVVLSHILENSTDDIDVNLDYWG
ncbi:8782_t:CDS:2 [Entrophospora sp. SA101]|nr:8782_t:CDS:2 [Entrophospora sp. SA101]